MMIYDDMEPSEKLKIYDRGFSVTSDRSTDTDYQLMISYRTGDMWAPQLSTKEALAVEAENLVSAIRGRGALVSDGRSGLRVVRILEAAQRSIRDGGSLVSLAPYPAGTRP